MEPITIARVMMEIKLLQKRIDKSIDECNIITVTTRNDKLDVANFSKLAQSHYDSVIGLIERRDHLKSCLTISNATTNVKIANKTYTVSDVIERKRNIISKKLLLDRLRVQHARCLVDYENKKEAVKAKLDRLLEVEFGKDSKSNSDNVKSITDNYFESNKVDFVDPVDIKSKIHELDEYIMEFEKEADLVLTESNATTYVSV
jgi:hypothetical protein